MMPRAKSGVQELALLMAMRVQGTSSPERLGAALSQDAAEATGRARELIAAGLAERREAPVSGFILTEVGHDALADALKGEGLRHDNRMAGVYQRFINLNSKFLRVATDWQTYRRGGVEVRNDHSDPDYDQAVIDRLREVHAGVAALLKELENLAGRFGHYSARFERCVERLLAGDTGAVTAVQRESYHTIWFELHEDLILTLGIERTE